jgi:DNA-binding NarL/FixJ family response regulator
MAWSLRAVGLDVEISTKVIDYLCEPQLQWDVLLVDLDSTSSFLRGLLPAVRRLFPQLSMVGWVQTVDKKMEYIAVDMGLDGYLPKSIKPTQLPKMLPYLTRHLETGATCVPTKPAYLVT